MLGFHKMKQIGEQYKSKINFLISNLFLNEFTYYYSKVNNPRFQYSSLGFGSKFEDYKYSITHILKEKKIISKAGFGFRGLKDNICSMLFGEIPKKHTNNLIKTKCKTNGDTLFWGCQISKININFKSHVSTFNNNYNSYYQTNIPSILFPKMLFKTIIINKFLQDYLNKKICIISEKLNEVICNCDELEYFPQLTFVFEQFFVSIGKNELFTRTYIKCYLNIHENNENDRL